jgi:Ca2+-binding RTX toxin-like protein
MTDAEIGTYTLVSAASGAVGIEDLQNMVFTVTGSGAPDFTLSVNGTSTSDFADLVYEGNSLKLQVKIESSIVKPQTQTWEEIEGATQYIVEYSTDNFEHVIQVVVDSNSLDSFQMPAGSYQMRVKPEGGEWSDLESVDAAEIGTEPKFVKSNEDGNADVFFANSVGSWESGYLAQHVGSMADPWGGTKECATLLGKNKLVDIIEGSTDANILLMTDDDNGDALFVDDIYTALPGSLSEQQSRIARIDEIRAGFGNDIVDMTSQQFEYIGDGLTIRGGAGNDTIWANQGDNRLFGDAGNDRIVGASGDDVITGGIGNDRMHGGGGEDVFTFCDNWGSDTVEQLATGSVTLWFASGDEANWNAETLTYTDGDNSVKVSGVTAEQVKLKFGDDGSAQFASLTSMGAFYDVTSERIFEESGKGILASL